MRTKLTLLLLAFSMGIMLAQPNRNIAKTSRISYDWRQGFVSITEATGAPGLGLTDDGLSKYYYGITTVAGMAVHPEY